MICQYCFESIQGQSERCENCGEKITLPVSVQSSSPQPVYNVTHIHSEGIPAFHPDFLLSYSGRINRQRYILYSVLLYILPYLVFMLSIYAFVYLDLSLIDDQTLDTLVYVTMASNLVFVQLPVMYAGICLSIKRLHDQNKSGIHLLWGLIPILGSIYIVYLLYFKKGSLGGNLFGEDPLRY